MGSHLSGKDYDAFFQESEAVVLIGEEDTHALSF